MADPRVAQIEARLAAAARAYLAIQTEVDAAVGMEDDDPRWAAYFEAADEFQAALGYGFCAEQDDVARTVVLLADELEAAVRRAETAEQDGEHVLAVLQEAVELAGEMIFQQKDRMDTDLQILRDFVAEREAVAKRSESAS